MTFARMPFVSRMANHLPFQVMQASDISKVSPILIKTSSKNLIHRPTVCPIDRPCSRPLSFSSLENECSLEQVYLRRNRTFVRGLPVEVTQITAERVYNPVSEFLYPYL